MKKSEISIEEYKKKFKETENQFTLARKRYEETLFLKDKNLDILLEEKNKLEENNNKLRKDLKYQESRIIAKDEEIQGYLDDIKTRKETIEKLSSDVSKKDYYAEQYKMQKVKFDKLTSQHNDLVHKANQTKLDKDELEVELERIQKELQQTKNNLEKIKKNMIDPNLLEEARNHVRELVSQLEEKEKDLYEKESERGNFLKEFEDTRNKLEKQKEDFEKKLESQKNNFENRLKKQEKEIRENLKNYMRPGEIKAIGILLDKVDIASYTDVDYTKAMKDLKTARDKFRSIAEDPETPYAKRLFYEKIKIDMDYKIDLLNMENGKPIETVAGNDLLSYTKKGVLGSLNRLWISIMGNKANIIIGFFGAVVGFLGNILYYSLVGGAHVASKTIKHVVVPAATIVGPVIGQTLITGALELPKCLIWISEHTYSLLVGAIALSISFYNIYGEESSFPILPIWSLVLAFGLVVLHYLEETYKSAKRYIPFTN